MKTLKLIALAAFALLFSQCKTTAPTAPTGPAPSLLEVAQILDTIQSKFFQFADSTNGDPWKAIARTADWMKSQSQVQNVVARDGTDIDIILKSGLITTFSFDQINADSISVFRGGKTKDAQMPILYKTGLLSTNSITNHKVLFYGAANSEFYQSAEMIKVVDNINNSPVPLKLTLMLNEECTPQLIETFKDYGLVILDTHGAPDAFLSGISLYFAGIPASEDDIKAKIIGQVGADTYNKILTGEIRIANHIRVNTLIPFWQKFPKARTAKLRLLVTTKYISELPPMPNTVLFGNTCYSGAEVDHNSFARPMITMQKAWTDRDPICYYSYATNDGSSAPVGNGFAKVMLDTLIRALAIDIDSTGKANLQFDNTEFFEQHYIDSTHLHLSAKLFFRRSGADDYSYGKCRDTITDERDGQKYPTVCIGTQIWMAQNLNYNAPGSLCYQNNSGNCDTYGRLYDMTTMTGGQGPSNSNPSGVQGVCPKGWHVPSSNEFSVLQSFLGFDDGGAMKAVSGLWASPNTGATNSSGFSALPGGHAFDSTWSGLGQEAWFGSTSTIFVSPSNYWLTFGVRANLSTFDANQALEEPPLNWYTSCRCVKDP